MVGGYGSGIEGRRLCRFIVGHIDMVASSGALLLLGNCSTCDVNGWKRSAPRNGCGQVPGMYLVSSSVLRVLIAIWIV